MTALSLVPELEIPKVGLDGTEPPEPDDDGFDEHRLIAQRIIESAIGRTKWFDVGLAAAKWIAPDDGDARIIAQFVAAAHIEVTGFHVGTE